MARKISQLEIQITGRTANQYMKKLEADSLSAKEALTATTAEMNRILTLTGDKSRKSFLSRKDLQTEVDMLDGTTKKIKELQGEYQRLDGIRKQQNADVKMYDALLNQTKNNISDLAKSMDNLANMSLKQVQNALKQYQQQLQNIGKQGNWQRDMEFLMQNSEAVKALTVRMAELKAGSLDTLKVARENLQMMGKSISEDTILLDAMMERMRKMQTTRADFGKWNTAVASYNMISSKSDVTKEEAFRSRALVTMERSINDHKFYEDNGSISENRLALLNQLREAYNALKQGMPQTAEEVQRLNDALAAQEKFVRSNYETQTAWAKTLSDLQKKLANGKAFSQDSEKSLSAQSNSAEIMKLIATRMKEIGDQHPAFEKLQSVWNKLNAGKLVTEIQGIDKVLEEQIALIKQEDQHLLRFNDMLNQVASGNFPTEKMRELSNVMVEELNTMKQGTPEYKRFFEAAVKVFQRDMGVDNMKAWVSILKEQRSAFEGNTETLKVYDETIASYEALIKQSLANGAVEFKNLGAASTEALEKTRKELKLVMQDGQASEGILKQTAGRMKAVDAELARRNNQVLNNPVGYTSQEINRAISSMKQMRDEQALGSAAWNTYNESMKKGQQHLDEFDQKAKRTRMVLQFGKGVENLSDGALAEQRKYWQEIVTNTERGTKLYAAYEARLKAVTAEEQKRADVVKQKAAAEAEAQRASVMSNVAKSSVTEIQNAIKATEQLRDAQVKGSAEWTRYSQQIDAAKAHLKQFDDYAKGQQMMKQYRSGVANLSDNALQEQKKYWQEMVSSTERGRAIYKTYVSILQKVTAEEQKRVDVVKQKAAAESEAQRASVMSNVAKTSVTEIQNAIKATEQLRDAQTRGSQQWQTYNQQIIAAQNYLQGFTDRAKRAQMNTQLGAGVQSLSTNALEAQKKYWQDMVNNTTQGSRLYDAYVQKLKQVTDEEQRRANIKANAAAQDAEIRHQDVMNNLMIASVKEIQDAVKATEVLRDAQSRGSAEWDKYNQQIQTANNFLQQFADRAKRTQMNGQLNNNNIQTLSTSALEAQKKYWTDLVNNTTQGTRLFDAYQQKLAQVTAEEERRANVKKAQQTADNEVVRTNIMNNLLNSSVAEIKAAIIATEQLRDAQNRGGTEWATYNSQIEAATKFMQQFSEQERMAKANASYGQGVGVVSDGALQEMKKTYTEHLGTLKTTDAMYSVIKQRIAEITVEEQKRADASKQALLNQQNNNAQAVMNNLAGSSRAEIEHAMAVVKGLQSNVQHGSQAWYDYQKQLDAAKAKLEEFDNRAAQLRMTSQLRNISTLSNAALADQEKFWKKQIEGASQGSAALARYEVRLAAVQAQQKTNAMSNLGLTANGTSFYVGTTGMLAQLNDQSFPKTIEWLNKLKQEVEAFKTKFVTTPEGAQMLNQQLEMANTRLQALGATAASTGQQNLFTLDETRQKMDEILANMTARKHPFVGDSGDIEKMNASLKKLRENLIKNGLGTVDVDRAIRGMKGALDTTKVSLTEFDRILAYPKGEQNIEKVNHALEVLRGRVKAAGEATSVQAAQMRALDKQAKELNKTFGYHASTLENAALRLKSYIMIYMGFNAMMMKARQMVSSNLELADSISNIQKVSMLERQEVEKLSVALQDLNTRVGQSELLQLAYQGSKMGVAAHGGVVALQQFVESANKLNSALGEDFGGTEAIGKLTKLAQVMHITGVNNDKLSEGLERTGSAILRLGNTSTASYAYIQQFASRLGGIASQAKIAMPELLAIGSTLDTMQMPAEMAATAMTKFIATMSKKPENIEKALGITDGSLKKLVDAHQTMDAITLVFGTLKEKKADLASIANVLKDLVGGGNNTRALQVLTSMANGYDTLIEHLHTSTEAFEEATAVEREYALMNENAAGFAKRMGNAIAEMFVSVGQSNVLGGLMKTLAQFFEAMQKNGTMLIGIIGAIMARMGLWGKLWTDLKTRAMAYSLDRQIQLETERIELQKNQASYSKFGYTARMAFNGIKVGAAIAGSAIQEMFAQIKTMASAAWWIAIFEVISGIVERTKELGAAAASIYGAEKDMNAASTSTMQRITYLTQTIGMLNGELRKNGVEVTKTVTSERQLVEVTDEMTEAQRKAAKETNMIVKARSKHREELVKNARELERTNQALNEAPTALECATHSTKQITNAVVEEKDATEETKKKVDEYNEAHKALWGYLENNFSIQDLYLAGIVNERGEIINLAGAYELLRQKIEASNQAKYANEQHEQNRANLDNAMSGNLAQMRKFLQERFDKLSQDEQRSGKFSVEKVLRDWKESYQKNIDSVNSIRTEIAALLRENNMLSPAQLLNYSGDDDKLKAAKKRMEKLDAKRQQQEAVPIEVPQSYKDFLEGTPNQGMGHLGKTAAGMVKFMTRGIGNWWNGEDFTYENRNLDMGAMNNIDRNTWDQRMQATMDDAQDVFYRAEELTDTVLGIYDPVTQTYQEIVDELSDLNNSNGGNNMTDISPKVIAKIKDAIKDSQEQTGRMFDDVIAILNEQAKNGSLDADHLETKVKDYTQKREHTLEAVNRFVHRENGAVNPIMDVFTEEQLEEWEQEAIEFKNETMRRAVAQLRQNSTLANQNANLAHTGMTAKNAMGVVPKTKHNKKGEVSSQEYIDWENVRKAVVEMGEDLDLKIAEALRKQAQRDGDRAKMIRAAILEGAPLSKVNNEFYKTLADLDIFFNYAADRSEQAVQRRLTELQTFSVRITTMTYEEFQQQLETSRYYRGLDAVEQKVLYDKLLKYRDDYDEAARKKAKLSLKLLTNRVESGQYYEDQLASLKKYQQMLIETGQAGSEAYMSVARAIEVVSKKQNMLVDGKMTTYQQRQKASLEKAERNVKMEEAAGKSGINNGVQVGAAKLNVAILKFRQSMEAYQIRQSEAGRILNEALDRVAKAEAMVKEYEEGTTEHKVALTIFKARQQELIAAEVQSKEIIADTYDKMLEAQKDVAEQEAEIQAERINNIKDFQDAFKNSIENFSMATLEAQDEKAFELAELRAKKALGLLQDTTRKRYLILKKSGEFEEKWMNEEEALLEQQHIDAANKRAEALQEMMKNLSERLAKTLTDAIQHKYELEQEKKKEEERQQVILEVQKSALGMQMSAEHAMTTYFKSELDERLAYYQYVYDQMNKGSLITSDGVRLSTGLNAGSMQHFAEGGFIRGAVRERNGDGVVVRVNAGEAVLTPEQQRTFMALANGKVDISDKSVVKMMKDLKVDMMDMMEYIKDYKAGYMQMTTLMPEVSVTPDEESWSSYSLRKHIYDRIDPIGYNIGKAISDVLSLDVRKTDRGGLLESAWAMYLGLKDEDSKYNKYDYFEEALYSPSKGTAVGHVYKLKDESLLLYDDNLIEYAQRLKVGENTLGTTSNRDAQLAFRYFTIGHGKDERGHYLSYYDEWNLSPFSSNGGNDDSMGVGKPFSIYGRRYFSVNELNKIWRAKHSDALVLDRFSEESLSELPKFHIGGYPGLRQEEIPVVAQKGEVILTPDQQRTFMDIANGKIALNSIDGLFTIRQLETIMFSNTGKFPYLTGEDINTLVQRFNNILEWLYSIKNCENNYNYPEEKWQNGNVRNESSRTYKAGHPLENSARVIVIHHTGDYTTQSVRNTFTGGGDRSAHAYIDKNGHRFIVANPEQVTFHAGPSKWGGYGLHDSQFKSGQTANDYAIGIEMQGDTSKEPLTNDQIESLVELLRKYILKYQIPLENVVSHGIVAQSRKADVTPEELKRIKVIIKKEIYDKHPELPSSKSEADERWSKESGMMVSTHMPGYKSSDSKIVTAPRPKILPIGMDEFEQNNTSNLYYFHPKKPLLDVIEQIVEQVLLQSQLPGLPKFHTGGFPGLQQNEVPVVAKKGEAILTSAQQKRLLDLANGKIQPNGSGKIEVEMSSKMQSLLMKIASLDGNATDDEKQQFMTYMNITADRLQDLIDVFKANEVEIMHEVSQLRQPLIRPSKPQGGTPVAATQEVELVVKAHDFGKMLTDAFGQVNLESIFFDAFSTAEDGLKDPEAWKAVGIATGMQMANAFASAGIQKFSEWVMNLMEQRAENKPQPKWGTEANSSERSAMIKSTKNAMDSQVRVTKVNRMKAVDDMKRAKGTYGEQSHEYKDAKRNVQEAQMNEAYSKEYEAQYLKIMKQYADAANEAQRAMKKAKDTADYQDKRAKYEVVASKQMTAEDIKQAAIAAGSEMQKKYGAYDEQTGKGFKFDKSLFEKPKSSTQPAASTPVEAPHKSTIERLGLTELRDTQPKVNVEMQPVVDAQNKTNELLTTIVNNTANGGAGATEGQRLKTSAEIAEDNKQDAYNNLGRDMLNSEQWKTDEKSQIANEKVLEQSMNEIQSETDWQDYANIQANAEAEGATPAEKAEAEQLKADMMLAVWERYYQRLAELANQTSEEGKAAATAEQQVAIQTRQETTAQAVKIQQTEVANKKQADKKQLASETAKQAGMAAIQEVGAQGSMAIGNMVAEASGSAALGQLTAGLAQAGANALLGIVSGTADSAKQGWWMPAIVMPILTALIGAAMGAATSKVKKAKTQISQATGAGSGKLTTGMLTYATGRYLEDGELDKGRISAGMLTMADGYQPGQSYSVDGADGNSYDAKFEGEIDKTGIRKGTHFGIFSEVKPEMVIDGDTTALMHNKYPMLENAILQLHRTGSLNMGEMLGLNYAGISKTITTLQRHGSLGGFRMPTFADGRYPEMSSMDGMNGMDGVDGMDGMNGVNASSQLSQMNQLNATLALLQQTLADGIGATVDSSQASRQLAKQKRFEKRNGIKNGLNG